MGFRRVLWLIWHEIARWFGSAIDYMPGNVGIVLRRVWFKGHISHLQDTQGPRFPA